jgi:hypothetical protein
MKKNKIYIILVILAIISLLSFAALCSPDEAITEGSINESEDEETVANQTDTTTTEVATEEEREEANQEETIEKEDEEETVEEIEEIEDLEEEDTTVQAVEQTIELSVEIHECGYLIENEEVLHKYDFIQYVGDTENNNHCKGFISYNLSPLLGTTVNSAVFKISPFVEQGNPSSFYPISFYAAEWGQRPILSSDFNLSGTLFHQSNTKDINCNSIDLKNELQSAINNGKSRFQIIFYFTGVESDNDNEWDGWTYSAQANGQLTINYIP